MSHCCIVTNCLLVIISACSPPPLAEVGNEDTLQSLKYKLSRVKDLRSEIDKLRGIISDKYAEDMGDNLNCITQ